MPPILERLKVNGENWLGLMRGFNPIFRRAAGHPDATRRDGENWGRRRPSGLPNNRAVFG